MKVLVVDDQRWSREGIIGMIEWEDLGLELAGESANGEEALSFLRERGADILITDVRMPLMDGLTLVEQAQQLDAELQCLVVSGFDDFAYVRRSLQLSVFDYILKPSDPEELNAVLKRMAAKRKAALDEESRWLQISREQFFHSFVEGFYDTKELLLQEFKEIGCGEPDGPIVPVLIDELRHGLDLRQALALVKLDAPYALIRTRGVHLLFIAAGCCLDLGDRATKEALAGCFQPVLGSASVIIGTASAGILGLEQSVRELMDSYAMLSFLPAAQRRMLWSADRIAASAQPSLPFMAETLQEWEKQLAEPDRERAQQALQLLLDRLRSASDEQADGFLPFLFMKGLNCLHKNGLIDDAKFTEGAKAARQVSLASSFAAKEQLLLHYFHTCLKSVPRYNDQDARHIVAKIKAFVDAHYCEELQMSEIARQNHLSPGYFSLLFRQITGANFIDYTTALRMNRAAELIRLQQDIKIQEVAAICGYQDLKYFRKLFRKHTGCTPLEYRERSGADGANVRSNLPSS